MNGSAGCSPGCGIRQAGPSGCPNEACGFTHSFAAYRPPARRKYGYYVCPHLVDGHLTARADLARREAATVRAAAATMARNSRA